MLSIVIPAYNEEKMILKTTEVVSGIMEREKIPFELVFVNDGSKDQTWEMIEKAAEKNSHVTGIRFSRNFGKESALFAGLANAEGDCIAVMDCDLQHPPETLVEMYRLWEQGYEVIEGVKRSRGKESILHRASAGMFYKIMSKAVQIDMSRASDFKLMDRKAVEALLSMPERNAFFRALSSWVGYRTTSVEFDVQERTEGESKWSTWSLIKYAVRNIDQHLDGKLTLPELAQMSCMSVPSFCKKFKEQTKMTVTQYINEKRVAYAATLLKQSKYSLEEVAELAGFSNANYLLRVFKKSTGKTIGQYRKQIKF